MRKNTTPKDVFKKYGGMAHAKQLLSGGLSYYILNELLESGEIVKQKHGLYRWVEVDVPEMAEVAYMVKKVFIACFRQQFTMN